MPRWSVVRGLPWASTARALLPASMAGLPVRRAMVWVGPPLFCNPFGSRPGAATPTWFPLTPLTSSPMPAVPIKLYALAVEIALRRFASPMSVPLRATIELVQLDQAADVARRRSARRR